MKKETILITGASGFIGRHLISFLQADDFILRCSVYNNERNSSASVVKDIGAETMWQECLADVNIVVHLAAYVQSSDLESMETFRQINVEGTLNLARQAAVAGVKRFVFISSIKVNGEETTPGSPFSENTPPKPQGFYAISKYEAEQGLRVISEETGLDVVIVRPPLVYGPDVKGNFKTMIRWAGKGIPLPLGAIQNKRSLVAIDNLVDFIVTCIKHPAAANQTFVVSDDEDLSTTQLLKHLSTAMEKSLFLIPVPVILLRFGAGLFGKREIVQRLCDNLQVDIAKARDVLGWQPIVSVDEGLRHCITDRQVRSVKVRDVVIRCFDIVFSILGLILAFPVLLLLVGLSLLDTGSPIFRQQRVGYKQQQFILFKFRTMKVDTESVASHLASASSITPFGQLLRRTKLDELPQLWNVIKGEMSLVGPRPCLFNQDDLIQERETRGVFNARPGITGLAQVSAIDMSTPQLLAETDQKMLENLSVKDYFRYIFMTVAGKGAGDRVKR